MKKCIFLLLSLLSLSLSARAWNPYLMNHERFVHMSSQEKETIIIRTMEMMVEMESKYQLMVQSSAGASEELEKIVQVLNQLRQFLISDVVAAEFGDMGKQFAALLVDPKLKGKLCIYGGWISQIVTLQSGAKFCVHPSKASYQKIKDAYNAAKNTCTENQISCNPMVFGYKKAEGQKPFCVATGSIYSKQNKSHNVSYECMRASLQVDGSADQDSKEVRLAAMTKAIEGNPDAFNQVHKFIFRTCACAEGEMNQFYKDYIRPHRTCFGMMNSLRALKYSECGALTSSFPKDNTEFIEKWNAFFNDENTKQLDVPYGRLPNQDDAGYKALIQSENVKKYCDGDVPPPGGGEVEKEKKFACTAKCEVSEAVEGGKSKYTCKVTESKWEITGGQPSEAKLKVTEFKDILAGTTSLEVEIQQDDGTIVKEKCPIDIKEDEVKLPKGCSITVNDFTDNKDKSVAILKFEGYEKNEVPDEIKWSPEGTADEKDPNTKVFDKTEAEQVVKVTYKIKGQTSPDLLSCERKIPAKEAQTDDIKYEITAKTDAPSPADAPTVDVKATVTINGEDKTNDLGELRISWTYKGDAAPKGTTVKKEKETSSGVGDVIPDDEGDKKDKNEEGPKTPEGEVGTGTSITATRGEKVYQACASLLDKAGTVKAEPSCDDVPLLKKEKPFIPQNNQNFNNNQRQQNFNMPRNTSFGGVK